MKKHKTVISIVMVIIMSVTLIPHGIFASENSSILTKQELAQQKAEFEEDKMDKAQQEEQHNDAAQGISTKENADTSNEELLREPDLVEDYEKIDGRIIDYDAASITYETAENSYVTRIFADPITYTDKYGNEKLIDNTIKEKLRKYENTENSYDLTLPKKGDEITIEENDISLKISPMFGTLSDGLAEENAVRYNDVTQGIDLQYTAFGSAVKEDIILMQPTEMTEFKYSIEVKGNEDKKITYKLENNVLNVYRGQKVIYTISAPMMEDADGNVSDKITLELNEEKGRTILSLIPDSIWLADPQRVYPVKIDPTIALNKSNLEWHMVENGRSGGNYGAGPNVDHKRVTYLYVGFEDGSLLGSAAQAAGAYYGQTRSYLKLNYDFAGNLPDDAIITAYLKGYKYAGNPPSGTKVYCKMVNSGWRGSSYTWNTQPTSHSIISDAVDVSSNGWKTWDISTAVREWKNGAANHGLVLAPVSESQKAVCFSGPGNPTGGRAMYLDIYWTVPNPVDENMPLDEPAVNLRPLTLHDDSLQLFTGLIADGIVRPQLDVSYSLKKSEDDEDIAEGTFKKAYWGRKFPNTELIKGQIPFTLGYTGLFESNWQSAGIPASLMEEVTPYYISAIASGQAGTTPEGRSDEFIIYEFTKKDTYPYVAKYYGTTVEQIVKDNRPHDYLGTAGSTIFIRNPKQNKTTEYTRDAKLSEEHSWDIVYANLGRGSCTEFDLEPINTSTGNFWFESADAENADYTDSFTFARTYNSIGDKQSGLFGYGWNFEYEQSITRDENGYIYNAGDGARFVFEKDSNNKYTCKQSPYMVLTTDIDEKAPEKTTFSIEDTQEKLVYKFNCYGLLTSVTDEKDLSITVSYDEKYMIKSVTTKSGKAYTFTVNDEGLVTEVTMPSGLKMHYQYEGNCLTSFTNADGDKLTYEYDKNHFMIWWSDGNGVKQIENTYDEYGRVIKQKDASGGTSTLTYKNSETTITDAEGNVRTYEYDDMLRTENMQKGSASDDRQYDDAGNLIRYIDPEGNRTLYTYDAKGNLTKEQRSGGRVWTGTYDASGNLIEETDYNGNTTKRTYDDRGNMLTETYADGSSISYTYDSFGRKTSFTNEEGIKKTITYDGITSMTVTDSSGSSITYYDAMGREINIVDEEGIEHKTIYSPAGKKTGTWITGGFSESYSYDHAGNCIRIVDGTGNVSNFGYDKQNNIISVTDGNGDTTRYGYDKTGNKMWEENPEGENTSYTYDARGNMTSMTDGEGHTVYNEYDGLDRLIKTTNPAGGITTYDYYEDTANITEEKGESGTISYTYDKNGNDLTIRNQAGAVTEKVYDNRNRLLGITYPSGLMAAHKYSPSGNLILTKDSNGREYVNTYDDEGNVLTETDAHGDITSYAYDKTGKLINMTDASGNNFSYEHDGAGNLIKTTNPDGSFSAYKYDQASRLIETTDENGNVTSYEYDGIGQLIKQKDALGGVTIYTYDNAEKLIKVTDTRGYTESYSYDKAGNLRGYTDKEGAYYETKSDAFGNPLKVTAPDGGEILSEYDEYGRVIEESDKEGYIREYEYDKSGRLVKEFDNSGSSLIYSYDKEGKLIAKEDALGRRASFEYDIYGNLIKEITFDNDQISYEYDKADNIVKITENDGSITEMTYDALGNIISEKLPLEREYSYIYDYAGRLLQETNPIGEKTAYSYDNAGNILKETYADGSSISYTYDALNRVTSYTDAEGGSSLYSYDTEGNLTKETDPEGGAKEYIYDGRGNLLKEMDRRGAVTEYQYDVIGNPSKTIYPNGGEEHYTFDTKGNLLSEKNRSGAVTKYTYEADGKLLQQKNDNGYTISYAYDKAGRVTKTETSEGAVRSFTYDAGGNISKLKEETGNILKYTYDEGHRILSQEDSKGAKLRYEYDEAGNNTKIIYPTGGSITYTYDKLDRVISEKESSLAKINYTYDAAGNIIDKTQKDKTEKFTYDKTGNLITELTAEGRQNSYTYDKRGLVTSMTDPLGRKTSYEYDKNGNLTSYTDAAGGKVNYAYDEENNILGEENQMGETFTYVYDKAGRLTEATDAIGRTVKYQYDKMDNLTARIEGDGSQTNYSYDKMGNLIKEETPSGKITKYTYDAAGRMTAKINPDGSRIKYDYDVLSNLVSKQYSDGTKSTIYGYDAAGNLITMDDESGKSRTTYDELGRVSTITDANGQKLKYTYDEYDRISKITYPKGREVVYTYDRDDNITRVSDNKGITAAYTYDAAGNIITCSRSDGTTTSYSYDAGNNLTNLSNTKGNHIISSYSYEYDKADRIIKETERKDSRVITTSFTYDKAGQLTGYIENEDGKLRSTTYTYNAAGNRVSVTKGGNEGTITVTYNSDDQVVSETNSKTKDKIKYIYDDNGNLVKKKTKGKSVVYQYDIENRLKSVSQGGQLLMAATYDGMDNKVFQMSRKLIERDVPKEDDDGEDDEDSEIGGTFFDPDMFMYGFMQGGMKMGASTSPTLVAGIGDKLCEIWDGIRTYFTGKIEYVDPEELADIVVPGTERGIFITYDITNYLNDTVFNEYTQVMYQYDEKDREKASYVYGPEDERISADKTRRAVSYVADKPGSYTYMYDGHGSVTQELRSGKEVNSYYYDPYGAVERGTEENDIIFGYNGEEYTEATQLQYLRQRHYAPDLGSFLTQDMYRGDLYEPNSQNRYTYAGNDPVNYNDPGGDKRRSVADKTSYGGSNRRGSDKAKIQAEANKNLKNAINSLSGAAKNLYNTLTSNAAAAAHNSPRSSTSKSSTTAYTRQQMAKQAVESFKNSNNLFSMAEFLQRGFECDGGKVSNSGPRGTREPAGPRREYKVPIEDRPGVWAIGGEFSLSVLGIYFTLSPQIVIDAKGKAVIYIGYSDGINKGVDIKPYETLNQKGLPFSFGGGVTYTVINAPSIEEYVDADQMLDIGGGVGKGSFSVLRFKKEEDYYYGGTVGIGKYSPNVHAGLVENEGIVIHLN